MGRIAFAFVVVATMAMGGCKDKSGGDKPKAETSTAPAAQAPAAGGGAMDSTECKDYSTVVGKLVACEKMPKAERDSLKKEYDDHVAEWAKAPADAKPVLQACAAAAKMARMNADPACGL